MNIHDEITADGTETPTANLASALTPEQQARNVSPAASALRTYIRELSDAVADASVAYYSANFGPGGAAESVELATLGAAQDSHAAAIHALAHYVSRNQPIIDAFTIAAERSRRVMFRGDEAGSAIERVGAEALRRVAASEAARARAVELDDARHNIEWPIGRQ